MATQQVKFHKVVDPSFAGSASNPGDLYFVTASADSTYGELFKGDVRFGAARVTEIDYVDGKLTVPGAVRGDINISTKNGAEILGADGEWKGLSDASLTQRVENLEAVVSYSGTGDAVVTASTVAATTVSAGTVSANTVSAATVSATDVSATTVSATDGYFTNLTVSDTATFNATTVSATTLTVDSKTGATFGGSTIAQIADEQIAAIGAVTESSAAAGITVSVVTQSGSVTGVELAVAGATTVDDFNDESTDVATAKGVKAYVDDRLTDINGAMRFAGTTTGDSVADDGTVTIGTITKSIAEDADFQAGDVVVGTTTGKEYIYNNGAWHEIGDEGKIAELVTYTGLADKANLGKKDGEAIASIGSADDLTEAINNVGAAVDAMDAALTGGSDDDTDKGVKVSVETAEGSAEPTVDVEVTLTSVTADSEDDEIPSAKGVYDFVTSEINGLSSTVTAQDAAEGEVVSISVTETSGVLTSATVTVAKAEEIREKGTADNAHLATESAVRDAIDGLNAAITGGSSSMADNGVSVEVVTASVSAAPTVTVTVDAIEASTGIVTTETKVVTAGAVADLVASLDASVSSSTQTGLEVKVEETDGKLTSVTAELLWLDADGAVIA